MPRVCTICTHSEREEIDAALIEGAALRNIAQRFGTSPTALHRHKDHLPQHLAKASEAAEVAQADGLLDKLQSLNSETMLILREAREGDDNELALKAIARAEKQLELQAKLLGELNEGTTVNILVAPEWLELRARIVKTVAPYPQAAQALARALDAG